MPLQTRERILYIFAQRPPHDDMLTFDELHALFPGVPRSNFQKSLSALVSMGVLEKTYNYWGCGGEWWAPPKESEYRYYLVHEHEREKR